MQSIGHKNSRTKTCVSKNFFIYNCVCVREREHVLTCVLCLGESFWCANKSLK